MNRELVIETSLRKGDFRKLTYWNMFGKTKTIPAIFISMFIVGILIFAIGAGNTPTRVAGIFVMGAPLLGLLIVEFNIHTVNKRGHIEERTFGRITINDVGIRADADYLEDPLIYNWRNIEGAYESDLFYIIFVNRVQTITIRKTDISSEDEKLLLWYLNNYIPKGKNHIDGK